MKLAFACIVAFGLGICLPPLAATAGFGVVLLNNVVAQHLASQP